MALLDEWSMGFDPASSDRGTTVTLRLSLDPPVDLSLERLDVVLEALASQVLGRFKSLVETGESQTLDGNPSAQGTSDLV
jgi:hypothetical protein